MMSDENSKNFERKKSVNFFDYDNLLWLSFSIIKQDKNEIQVNLNKVSL